MSNTNLRYSTVLFTGLVVCFAVVVVAWYAAHPVARGDLHIHSLNTRIDINTASAAKLELLPGIGPAMARKIVTTRKEKGPFHTPADLLHVPRIGPVTEKKLMPLIRFGTKEEDKPAKTR